MMHDVTSIKERLAGLAVPFERIASEPAARRGATRHDAADGDRVELSDAAMNYSPESESVGGAASADPFAPRIADIRAQIADGTYLTPEKIDAVVEALYRELVGG